MTTVKGAVREANQINRQARTTEYERHPEYQSFLLPHLQPDSEQKERDMESVSVITATGFIPLDKHFQGLLWRRHCRKAQSIVYSLHSLAEDFPGSTRQQPGSHFSYGSSWDNDRKTHFYPVLCKVASTFTR